MPSADGYRASLDGPYPQSMQEHLGDRSPAPPLAALVELLPDMAPMAHAAATPNATPTPDRTGDLHRLLIDNAPHLVCILDRDGRFRFLNATVRHLLGHDPDALIGLAYAELVDGEDLEIARNLFDEQRVGTGDVRRAELRLRRHPNRPQQSTALWVDLTATRLRTADGTFAGVHVVARDISEDRANRQAADFQAYHDVLTQLPNRTLLQDRLEVALEQAGRKRGPTVIFLDLDRFKAVNDKFGHAMGDRLLQAVAKRLQECLQRGDTLSRFGGDEFVVLSPNVHTRRQAATVAGRLLQGLRTPFVMDGSELVIAASAGVALYPEAGNTARALIQNADVAMYHAKGSGGDGFEFFDGGMNLEFSARLAAERDLRGALAAGEIEVYYQPRVDLATGAITGVEALARWRHPERGLVDANDFLPVAEEAGLIGEIDEWVQRQAFERVAQWRADGHVNCRLSVNASIEQLDGADFVRHFGEAVVAAGLPPDAVTIEITENALMHDVQLVVPKLRHLRRLGVRVAIDNFGTGYSSLDHLRRLPVDALKIDRGFVEEVRGNGGDTRALDAIAGVARGLALDLLADGIENAAQLDYLRTLGCREGQGFVFDEPTTAAAMAKLLRGNPYRDRLAPAPVVRPPPAKPLPSGTRVAYSPRRLQAPEQGPHQEG